nr:MAG TPA: hypothetical protein [Crassvirales sp.]
MALVMSMFLKFLYSINMQKLLLFLNFVSPALIFAL